MNRRKCVPLFPEGFRQRKLEWGVKTPLRLLARFLLWRWFAVEPFLKQGGFEGVEKNEFMWRKVASDEFMRVRTDVRARASMSNLFHMFQCVSLQ